MYKPMYGVIIAFKEFRPSMGIFGSAWADPWYKHFQTFFESFSFGEILRNTLVITIYSMIVNFPLPIMLALSINQMQSRRFRRVYQTVIYLPHFISTVVMVGLILMFLSPGSGLIANLAQLFGAESFPNLMAESKWFSSIYVWTDVWQHVGWNSIIYIAALSAVDVTLYEAAAIDGASRFQRLLYIDLPMLIPTAIIMLILSCGNIMNVGFEKVYLM
ncbi:MAG: sugar ABC transporter permease, partial [Clostridia bacterium]|nr:sugar ABC transporter permease [Clostridia bacterium]